MTVLRINGDGRRLGGLALADVLMLATFVGFLVALGLVWHAEKHATLSVAFDRKVLAPPRNEGPIDLSVFAAPGPADAFGSINTDAASNTVKDRVAEAADADLMRDTAIMFAMRYDEGRPDADERLDPSSLHAGISHEQCPVHSQPFSRSPHALALTPDGDKLYVTLSGKEALPDWRVAVIDTASRSVDRWIDVRPAGRYEGTRPVAAAISPLNLAVSARPYLVVLNEYANFATVVDIVTDTIIGEFEAGFYGEEVVFNRGGTRLYVADRSAGRVRVFRIDSGPFFTEIANVPTGAIDPDRANRRDLDRRTAR